MTIHTSFANDHQSLDGTAPLDFTSQELVDVLQKIVQNAGALLDVTNCSLALLDAKRTSLVTLAALQKQGYRARQTRFQKNEGVAGWVAAHREPLVIADVSLDQRFKRLGRTPVGSIACVPLIDKEACIGTLTVSSPQTNAFDERKLHMLTIFAEQAVLAIRHARQAEIAQRQADQLEMLLNLSQGITTRLQADALYRTILVNAQRLVPSQRVLIYRYAGRAQHLVPVAELTPGTQGPRTEETGESEIAPTITIGAVRAEAISMYSPTSLIAWAAMHRHPMLQAPVTFQPDERCMPEEGAACAEMAVPLVSKEMLYGVLVLQRAGAFTSEELRLVRNLGNMAAAALENSELFQQVRADQEQWRAIWSASSDGIALVALNGCFIEANPAFGRIFGIDAQQVAGMECMELFGCQEEDGHEACRDLCLLHRAMQEQETLPYIEIDVPVKDAQRAIGLSVTPVLLANEPFCLVIARDVTAMRDVSRMKANFLSMITHELRSPINAINGYLDLALTGIAGDINEQLREFLQRARAGSEHLYALVEDLLLVSRADSGQLRLNRSVIDLEELVANAIEEMELTAKDGGITMQVDFADDVPRVYADGIRIQQVLRNLLSNALRFTSPGGSISIAARLVEHADAEAEEQRRLVEVRVRDSGCGIAPEYQERIFERFYQAPQAGSARSGGQGLGLAIVKMIIALHGGTITVESAPGEGSMFVFTLPGALA